MSEWAPRERRVLFRSKHRSRRWRRLLVRDRLGPQFNVGWLHVPFCDASVDIAPMLNIHQVLRPAEERSLANTLRRRGGFNLGLQASDELLHDPRRHDLPFAG